MKMQLRMLDGRSCLYIDDQPHPGIFCSTPWKYMKNFIDAGFDVFDTHPLTPHGWVGPDQYDYSETDEYLERFLSQKRDAKLIVRFWMGLNQQSRWEDFWWSLQNPDETLKINKQPAKHAFRNMPSYASLKWRREAGESLRRVVEHVEEKYGDKVVAYVPGCGPCGEWFHWFGYGATDEGELVLEDYSNPMLQRYREHLLSKYDNLDRLNGAWGAKYSDIEQIRLPEAALRVHAKGGNIRLPVGEAAVIDFYEVFNKQVALTLVDWSQSVKAGCRREKVVMNFYGYLWHNQEDVVQTRCGHNDIDLVLKSEDVDYIVAPIHYSFRQLEGVMSGQGPVAGAILRGKQYVHEMDGSTCCKTCWPCRDHHVPANPAETGELMRRDLGKVLMEGSSAWYMDLGGGMYDHPELVEQLRKSLRIARAHALQMGRNDRQVAVVLNSRDPYYYREAEPLLMPLLPISKQFELERMGLGYDDMTMEDLEHIDPARTAQYKFWIFPSAVHLDDRQVAAIRLHALRNGNAVLWNYAAGVSHGDGIDLERMEQITGFRCGAVMEPGEVAVTVKPGPHELLKDIRSPMVYGTYGDLTPDQIKYHAALRQYRSSQEGFQVSPRFYIETCDEAIGLVNDLPGQPAGLGVKRLSEWTSILSVAPLLPKTILRAIARMAGCHVFTDFLGQTYQCANHFGIFFHEDGQCRIDFPYPATITDIVEDRLLAEKATNVVVTARRNHSLLLRYS